MFIFRDGTGEIVDNDSDDDGVCDSDEIEGCTDATACNYDSTPTTDTDNDLCIYSIDLDACATCSGEQDGTGVIVDNDSDDDGYCNLGSGVSPEEILGCTQDWADNYNDEATEDDDSCFKEGCTEEWADNYDNFATQNTLEENVCFKVGCTYSWAFNHDSFATIDDDSCYLPKLGCIDNTACNFIPLTGDPNIDVNTDDGSCIYVDGICETCEEGQIVDNDSDDDGVCNDNEIVGCQDEMACNYMELATDAGECEFATGCESCSNEQDGTGFIIDNDEDG